MSNITLTNGVRSNLLALNSTQSSIKTTEQHLSTGQAVSSPTDDAYKYFASKGLSDRASQLTDRKNQIQQGVSVVSAASNALDSTESLVKQMSGILDSARSGTQTQRGSYQKQINSLVGQVSKLINDASYNGLNLVNSSSSSLTVYFSDKSQSNLKVDGVNFNASKLFVDNSGQTLTLSNATSMAVSSSTKILSQMGGFTAALSAYKLSTASQLAAFNSHADKMQMAVNKTVQKIESQAAVMGNNVAILNVRLDFTNNYINTLQTGSSNLTVADLNQESANLMSLNTRQSIATSALSMANSADQGILQLLR